MSEIASDAEEASGPPKPIIEQVRVRVLPNGLMNRRNAAKYLGRKPKTLAIWQTEGKGPKSVLIGGRRFYAQTILDEHIAAEVAKS